MSADKCIVEICTANFGSSGEATARSQPSDPLGCPDGPGLIKECGEEAADFAEVVLWTELV
jgi:hypothetical protein